MKKMKKRYRNKKIIIIPFRLSIFLLSAVIFFTSCGQKPRYEDYALKRSADLQLTQRNHPHGYGKSNCFHCHVKANIHHYDHLETGLTGLARELTELNGIESCPGCHGNNGVVR